MSRSMHLHPQLRAWGQRLAAADWTAAPEWLVLAAVLGIAALISYTHQREVWLTSGSAWPNLGPLLLDGLFAAAWLRMRRRRREGARVGALAWIALVLAMLGTLAGNLAAPWVIGRHDLLAYIVAAVPAVAFVLVWELVTGHARRSDRPGRIDTPSPAAPAAPPAPPLATPEPPTPRVLVDLTKPEPEPEDAVPTLRNDDQLLDVLRAWMTRENGGELPTARQIRTVTRVRHDRAKRLLERLEGQDTLTGTGGE